MTQTTPSTRVMTAAFLTMALLTLGCDAAQPAESDADAPSRDAAAADVGGGSGDASAAPSDTGAAIEDAGEDVGEDASRLADAGQDAGQDAGGPDLSDDPIKDRPLRILFVGNSFTFGGPVPDLMRDIAAGSGWPEPVVQRATVGGYSLERHRERAETIAAVDAGRWDYVVLQELSTRPTDNIGDPARFKQDATWFYDRARASSPDVKVVMYETWARHPDHSVYPNRFDDPAQMQAQLSAHYRDSVTYIPANATSPPPHDVTLAPAGSAWARHLGSPDAERLHDVDDYHAGANGQYLNALVIYATIFNRATSGAPGLGRAPGAVAKLQRDADLTTGEAIPGGPDGVAPPVAEPLAEGRVVSVDFGADGAATPAPWNNVSSNALSLVDALDDQGDVTSVDVGITRRLASVNEVGVAANTLGWPESVTRDTLWTGSFDDHATALGLPVSYTHLTLPTIYSV